MSESITLCGDSLLVLKDLPDNSVDSVVTDPPYGLKFMGKKWDYDVPNVELWREVFRVLKPGGHLLSFGGTRTYHRMCCAIEDAGFEIRDQLQWLYGSGFPKSHNGDHGGTALKPANEPIVLARKPLSEKTVALNFQKWGVGGLNIDESRIGFRDDKDKAKVNGPIDGTKGYKHHAAAMTGGIARMDAGSPLGRFPANVLLDETAAAMLDEQSGPIKTKLPFKKISEHTFGVADKELHKGQKFESQKGLGITVSGASRFFYVAKASKRERNAGLEGELKEKQGARPNSADNTGKFPDHDHRPTGGNNHPTVKPIRLMEYLIKLITPKGGIVLDPFMGSGSTGVATVSNGYSFIGIDLNTEYVEIADKRIGAAQKKTS